MSKKYLKLGEFIGTEETHKEDKENISNEILYNEHVFLFKTSPVSTNRLMCFCTLYKCLFLAYF